YEVHFFTGEDPMQMHAAMASTLDTCYAKIRWYQEQAREHGFTRRPAWPVIVLRSPKGWTGPKEVNGRQVEGTFLAHQVPLADVKTNPAHLNLLEEWMSSYRPEEVFDEGGRLFPDLAILAPTGVSCMGAKPTAVGGKLLSDQRHSPFQ